MGALGRVYGNGDVDLALTIRTFAIAEGRIHLWVGGGVVWDSDPQAEIAESWTKADPLLRAVGAPRVGAAASLRASACGRRWVCDDRRLPRASRRHCEAGHPAIATTVRPATRRRATTWPGGGEHRS